MTKMKELKGVEKGDPECIPVDAWKNSVEMFVP